MKSFFDACALVISGLCLPAETGGDRPHLIAGRQLILGKRIAVLTSVRNFLVEEISTVVLVE